MFRHMPLYMPDAVKAYGILTIPAPMMQEISDKVDSKTDIPLSLPGPYLA